MGGLGQEEDRSKKGSALRELNMKRHPNRREQSKIGGSLGERSVRGKPVLLRAWLGKAVRLRANGRVFVKTLAVPEASQAEMSSSLWFQNRVAHTFRIMCGCVAGLSGHQAICDSWPSSGSYFDRPSEDEVSRASTLKRPN